MTKMQVTDTDKGMQALLKQLGARMPVSVVGIIGDGSTRDDEGAPTNQQVGTWHEFGTGKIPKRSFIRDTFDINRADFNKRLKKVAAVVLDGADPRLKMARFGLYAEGVIKKRIAAGIPPALADVTIKRKGSSKPLIHTGQLRNSIASEVR